MLGKVYSKIQAIDAMIDVIDSLDQNNQFYSASQNLESAYNSSVKVVNENVTTYMNAMYHCKSNQTTSTCDDYHGSEKDALNAIQTMAAKYMDYNGNIFASKQNYRTALENQKSALESQKNELNSYLGDASPYIGGILDAESLSVENINDTYRADEWLQFDFDSEAFHEVTDSEETQESVTTSWSFHVLFFSGGGSSSYNKETQYHSDQLAKSKMKARGELLRVNIKRPWFKPEIFEDPSLTYVSQMDTKHSFVLYLALMLFSLYDCRKSRIQTAMHSRMCHLGDNLRPIFTTNY